MASSGSTPFEEATPEVIYDRKNFTEESADSETDKRINDGTESNNPTEKDIGYANSSQEIAQRKMFLESEIGENHALAASHLYLVMEYVGASEEARKVSQETALIHEIQYAFAESQLFHRSLSGYFFGSYSEGSSTSELLSDADMVMVDEDLNVGEQVTDNTPYVMTIGSHTKPGYVKLQRLYEMFPLRKYEIILKRPHQLDDKGKLFLEHVTLGHVDSTLERHGPAETKEGAFGIRDFDIVPAFRCKWVPTFAKDWIERDHPYNWPSDQQLERMATYGCFFVGIGHPRSTENKLEWRVSFSMQERALMFSLNPTQHKCYILLKMIKRDIIWAKGGKSISSYHIKTSLFYTIENTGSGIWFPDNLIYCTLLCLKQMLRWLHEEHCPNFFIPEENMFERLESDVMRQTAAIIEQIVNNGCTFIAFLQCDDVGELTVDSLKGKSNTLADMRSLQAAVIICGRILDRQNRSLHTVNRIIRGLEEDMNLRHCLEGSLERLCQILVQGIKINEQDDDKVALALHDLEPHLYLQIAVCDAVENTPVLKSRMSLGKLNYKIERGKEYDAMSADLVKASICLKIGRYDECIVILENCHRKLSECVISNCACYDRGRQNTKFANKFKDQNLTYANVTQYTATCLVFHRHQVNLTPAVLIYERYRSAYVPNSNMKSAEKWFESVAVDSKIYLYFLSYIFYYEIGVEEEMIPAKHNLECILQTDDTLGHPETGWNLLGWIYLQEKEYLKSIACFKHSWEIRPEHNAAKWHALVLIYKLQKVTPEVIYDRNNFTDENTDIETDNQKNDGTESNNSTDSAPDNERPSS